MPSRVTTVFACQSCGSASPKWLGRCPECGEWNSYVEEVRGPGPASPEEALSAPTAVGAHESEARAGTGMAGLDRVLGGGLVSGSVVLLGGEPGIGKSTFLLQAARCFAARKGRVV
jgi:DNA repair protein RadA/Sms